MARHAEAAREMICTDCDREYPLRYDWFYCPKCGGGLLTASEYDAWLEEEGADAKRKVLANRIDRLP